MKNFDKRKIKLLLTCILSILLIMSLVSCQMVGAGYRNFKSKFFPEEDDTEYIDIAIFEPISGTYSSYGALEINGINLANELYPEICGTKVRLTYLDNKSDMYEGEEVLKNNLNNSFTAVIGSYGEVLTLVCGERIKEIEIPALSVSATNSLVTVNNPYYFLTTYTDDAQGKALAKYAVNEDETDFVIIRISADDTTKSIRDEFNLELSKYDDIEVSEIDVEIDQTDYLDIIREIKEKNVSSVLLLIPENSAKEFMNQANKLDYYPLFLGTRDWDDSSMLNFIEQNSLKCAYCIEDVENSNSLAKEFTTKYKEKYGSEPTVLEAKAFDTYMILVKAIESAYDTYNTIDSDSIRKSIANISKFEGASGSFSFDGGNIANKSITIQYVYKENPTKKVITDDVTTSN